MDEQPVGYRFHPTDEEIIDHYLKLKMNGHDSLVDHVISEVDLTRMEPWELPDRSLMWSGDQVWYFYCRLKYKNRNRANRTTNCGFWKVTGKIRDVKAKRTEEVIGTKRTLVFHIKEGRDCKPTRTDWVIHEYQTKTTLPDQRAFVLCKLKDKAYSQNESSPHEEGEPSRLLASDFENLIAQQGNLEGISLDDLLASPNSGFGSDPQVYTNEENVEEWADSMVVEPGDYYDEGILGMNPSGSRIYKHEHQAGYQNLVGEEEEVSSRRIQLQGETSVAVCEKARDASRDDAAVELTPKRSSVVAPKQDREMARVITAEPTTKLGSNRSRGDELNPKRSSVVAPKQDREMARVITAEPNTKLGSNRSRGDELNPKRSSVVAPKQDREMARVITAEPNTKLGSNRSRGDELNPKRSSVVAPKQDREMARVITAEPTTKLGSNRSRGDDRKSLYIRFETPTSGHEQSPRSVYIVNFLVGLVLFIILWETLIF